MKVIVKVLEGCAGNEENTVTKSVNDALPKVSKSDVRVSKVFPGKSSGARSRMVSVAIPDNLPVDDLESFFEKLRKDPQFEYVSVPPKKKLL